MAIRRDREKKKSGNITIKELPSFSIMDKRPKFSFTYLTGKHCLSKCDKDEKAAFADTIHKLSQMAWGQISADDRHSSGYERIEFSQLKGISANFSEQKILVFRFMGLKAMLGFKDKEVFYVLALDRDFTCYAH